MDTKIRNLPDEIHHKFKVLCAIRRISINQATIDLIKKEVEEAEKQGII